MNPSKAQLGQPLILQSENNNFQINPSDNNNFLANVQQNNKNIDQKINSNATPQLALLNSPPANQFQVDISSPPENNKPNNNKNKTNNLAGSVSIKGYQNRQNGLNAPLNAEHYNINTNNPTGGLLQSTRWLTCMYLLAWILSTLGAAISLIIIILASDLMGSQFSSFFLTPSTYWAGFNFILLYLAFSGIVMLLTSYVIFVACYQNYVKIHHTQTVTLASSVLALAFGVCNFTQMSQPVGCSGASEACIYLTCSLVYYYGVIEVAALPVILLIGTQIKLQRLNNNPAMQIGKQQQPAVDPFMKSNVPPMMLLEQCQTPTDQHGNPFVAFGDNSSSQSPLKSNNFNAGQTNTGARQIELEQASQEAISPLKIKEQQAAQNISNALLMNSNTNKVRNSIGGDNLLNTKTAQSLFQETPTKDLSPIARAAQNMANRGESKVDNNNNIKKLFNPFGDAENGEIQLGKHPYLADVEDPKAGQMLDQVHQMVNSQVRSLIVDLKKRNQI